MKPFAYVVPQDLAQASAAAQKPGAVLKAGGLDLVDRLKERVVAPKEVVSLLPLGAELGGIRAAEGGLRIGALVTLTQLEQAAALADRAFAAVRDAAGNAASPQLRNRATVAGNVLQRTRCWYLRSAAFGCLHGKDGPSCLAQTGENRYHAVMGYHDCVRVHPSSLAPALLALDAEYTTQLGELTRRRPLAGLFPAQPTAEREEDTLEPGEIVTAFHVPVQPPGARSAWAESREKATYDWATTAAAVRLVFAGGVIESAALVLGAVAPVPLPRPRAAALLVGKKPDDELFRRVADAAFAGAVPLSQTGYKVEIGKAIVREALHAAAAE